MVNIHEYSTATFPDPKHKGLIFEQQVKLRKAIAASVSSPEAGSRCGRSGSPSVSRSESREGRKVMSPSMPLGRMKAPQKPETLAIRWELWS